MNLWNLETLSDILTCLGIGVIQGSMYSFLKDYAGDSMRVFIEDKEGMFEYVYSLTSKEMKDIVNHN